MNSWSFFFIGYVFSQPLYFYMYYTFIKLLSFYQCANTLGSHKLIPGTKVISSRVMIMHR